MTITSWMCGVGVRDIIYLGAFSIVLPGAGVACLVGVCLCCLLLRAPLSGQMPTLQEDKTMRVQIFRQIAV